MVPVMELPVMAQSDKTEKLGQFLRWLDLFRQINPDIASQQVALFVHVALKPGQTMIELSRKLGLSQSALTRNVAAMSKWSGINRPGYGLLDTEREGREKYVSLSPKGQRLLADFLSL